MRASKLEQFDFESFKSPGFFKVLALDLDHKSRQGSLRAF
jgi:hypothetical protein